MTYSVEHTFLRALKQCARRVIVFPILGRVPLGRAMHQDFSARIKAEFRSLASIQARRVSMRDAR
eukprot:COSAG01_NODE_53534_length_338_cov_1.355649_1_plen_64_part_01